MQISYNPNNQVFKLDTIHSSYLIKVVKGGFLTHLYYGNKLLSDDIDYVLQSLDRGFSGNPIEAEGDRTFSLDTLPLEYPTYGIGDFRSSAFCVELEDGSTATDLRYVSHKIYAGKPKLQGLPATYGAENEVMTLEILTRDYLSNVEVSLFYHVFNNYDVITRYCIVKNASNKNVKIKRVMSLAIDFLRNDFEMIHLYGRHASERNIERIPLNHASQSIDSLRGASSHHHNPFFALVGPGADEESGECYGFNLVYSGNFLCEVSVDQGETTRVIGGLHPTDFSWKLEPGETFTAPEVVMVYSHKGLNQMSRNFHNLYRNNLCRGKWKNAQRPVLINNWEATYFDFNEEKLLSIARDAKEIGIDLLVMDDGWFGNRNDDNCSLGDWVINEKKLPNGLKHLVQQVNKIGLKFGIWFEPEMISKDSDLYKAHQDWCIHVNGRNQTTSRNQLVLDMSRKDVQDYLFEAMSNILSSANIEYVKWDMNRHISEAQSALLAADRQREIWHRYILGVYSLLERLEATFPEILWEGCSGGGGRFDPGMLYYFPQSWTSDDTDAIERIKIQCGTSMAYPVSSMGAHVSAVPNHQTSRVTSLKTRGIVAMSGTFGYELDLNKVSNEEKEIMKEQIIAYKKYYHLINHGDYTRIENPVGTSNYSGWCFSNENCSQILLNCVQIRSIPNPPVKFIKIPVADETKTYLDEVTGKIYSGSVIKHVGIRILFGEHKPFFIPEGDAASYMTSFIEIGN